MSMHEQVTKQDLIVLKQELKQELKTEIIEAISEILSDALTHIDRRFDRLEKRMDAVEVGLKAFMNVSNNHEIRLTRLESTTVNNKLY